MNRAVFYGAVVGLSFIALACSKDDSPQTSSGASVTPETPIASTTDSATTNTASTTGITGTTNSTETSETTGDNGSQTPPEKSPPPPHKTPPPPVSCDFTVDIPAEFHNKASCQTPVDAPILYRAAPDLDSNVLQSEFALPSHEETSPTGTVGCGVTAFVTLHGQPPRGNSKLFCPGTTVKVDLRFGRVGQLPLDVAPCTPNPLPITLDKKGKPTCKPVATLTENAGTLSCSLQCL
jgi:hypothetical protein